MQIEAIYDQGRLEFQSAVTLKHQRFRVHVEIPDQEIAGPMPPTLPTYDPADFPPEIRDRVRKLAAVAEEAHRQFVPEIVSAESEEERQHWAAVELRLASRREQGRLP